MRQADLFDKIAAPGATAHARWRATLHRAQQGDCQGALLALFHARRGAWLTGRDFSAIARRYQLGTALGRALHRLAGDAFAIECRAHYFGAEHPGAPDYLGYEHQYRLREGNDGNEHH